MERVPVKKIKKFKIIRATPGQILRTIGISKKEEDRIKRLIAAKLDDILPKESL